MASSDPRENLIAMKGLVERYRKGVPQTADCLTDWILQMSNG